MPSPWIIRTLPLSVRMESLLQENGINYDLDYEKPGYFESQGFFFDDGSLLRTLWLNDHVETHSLQRLINKSTYFSSKEKELIAVGDPPGLEDDASIVCYWPSEKTALERILSGMPAMPQIVTSKVRDTDEVRSVDTDVDSVSEAASEEPSELSEASEVAAAAEKIPPRSQLKPWKELEYGVVGTHKGQYFCKSYLLYREDSLCFAMMEGPRNIVTQNYERFTASLKRSDDWAIAHHAFLAAEESALSETKTLTLMLDAEGHCRFFCAGIQPVYWSGRLKKLMRFPNTSSPLNSRLYPGDFCLMIPGGWTSREAAELRENFFYWDEYGVDKISTIIDASPRGKGILIRKPRSEA